MDYGPIEVVLVFDGVGKIYYPAHSFFLFAQHVERMTSTFWFEWGQYLEYGAQDSTDSTIETTPLDRGQLSNPFPAKSTVIDDFWHRNS